jgi:hypothetical protein
MLLEMTDAVVSWNGNLAGVGFFLSQDKLKESDLPWPLRPTSPKRSPPFI